MDKLAADLHGHVLIGDISFQHSLRENFVRAVERNERLRAALEEIMNYMETPDDVREMARRALEGAAVKTPR
jgi:hypothetical protein